MRSHATHLHGSECIWTPAAPRRPQPGVYPGPPHGRNRCQTKRCCGALTAAQGETGCCAEAKVWCEENLPKLPADQRAIILGLTPRGALSYDASPIPAALVVDPATGTTAVMVAQRDATRFTIQAENAQKAKMLDAYNAELSNNLFTSGKKHDV